MSYLVAFLLLIVLGSAAVLAIGRASARRNPLPVPAVATQAATRQVRRPLAHSLPKPPPLQEDMLCFLAGDRFFPPKTRFHIDSRFGEENRG